MSRIKWRRGLYAITDTTRFHGDELFEACSEVVRGGAVMLQYRDKSHDLDKRLHDASTLRKICHQHNAFLIIDNDVDLCLQTDSDGVHLGPNDMDIDKARDVLGPGRILGVSCHHSIERAHEAMLASANYVSFGAFYPSKTRPDACVVDSSLLEKICHFPIPVVAIGGINLQRAETLVQKGVDHVAVISDLWKSKNREEHARAYSNLFAGSSTIFDRGLS